MGPLAIVGCGDDDSGGNGTEDGGMSSPDINQINDDINDINGDVDNLNNDVTGIKKDVGDVQKNVGDLGDQLDDVASRIDKLENPDVPNCSSNDPSATCVPDGLKVVSKDIGAIVKQLCTLEITCCTKSELALKYGAGIETVDDCVNVFNDLLSNGFSPDLFHSGYGYVVNNVIEIVQALNDKRVKVAIDTKQVDACLASLKDHECPKFEETPVVEPPTHCVVPGESEEDPCSPMLLVKGLQEAGEPCNVGDFSVPQCKDKLVCRNDGEVEDGICATPAEEGDGCTNDFECDENLFCNHASAQCEKLGEEGAPCAYIDPTFKVRTPQTEVQLEPSGNNRGATSIDCKSPLTCDPKTKTCVAPCSAGTFCYVFDDNEGGNSGCPDKMVCNQTENPDLKDTWSLGVCRPATAKGKPCTVGSECVTGNCGFNDANDMVCLGALTADGGSCDAAGSPDATCKSGYCNVKGKCSKPCVLDEQTEQYGGCASSEFCRYETSVGEYFCEPKGANGDDCDVTGMHDDISCTSNFCDPAMAPTDVTRSGKCAARVAASAACPSSRHSQCPSTQYCSFDGSSTYTCTNFVAESGACNTTQASGDAACGYPAAYCNTSTFTCHAYADANETCSVDITDLRCNQGLTCDPTDLLCRENGKYPDAATCRYDTQCLHGWCGGQTQTVQYCMTAASNDPSCMGKCATPIADGKACDGGDTSKNRCVATDYCKYPDDDTAGKCVKRLTAGTKCAPRFGGTDCLNMIYPAQAGNCVLSNDAFVCDSNAIPDGQLFCDGN